MSSGDIRYARPSILELLRRAGENQDRPVYDRRADVEALRDEVRDNIREILNCRRVEPSSLIGYPEVARSHFVFGIPDLTALSRASRDDIKKLTREIEGALRVFEPRLDPNTIRVQEVTDDRSSLQLKFTIKATLRVSPHVVMLAFDTLVDVEKGAVTVTEEQE